MPPWGGLFNSRKDNVSDGSISPTPPNSRRDKRKEKLKPQQSSGHGMGHLREYTSGDDPRMYQIRNGMDPRSNGRFIDPRGMGFSSRGEEPKFIRSNLMSQFESTLTASIRDACIHWDDEVLHLENNYHSVLEERNGLKTENKNLMNRVKALEAEVNTKVALLREFQSGHLKTAGSRKLAPSSSAISDDYEGLVRVAKDMVLARVVRLSIKDPVIEALLKHQPFLDAVKAIMVDENEARDVPNVPLQLLEVVEETEKKGLLMWMIQGVIHDILHKKVMQIYMPGLNFGELQVMEKIFNLIALSEDGQGIKSAQEWRADTYRRLAYWAENVEELGKYIEASPAIAEIAQVFGDIISSTETEITRVLQPLCDESPEGGNFSRLIVDIVDRGFQFSILIGSQTARYELHRDIHKTDDFEAVPDHLDENFGATNNSNVSLFYAAPALIKTSGEDGESYDVAELLVQGRIYVLFGFGDPVGEEEPEPVVPPVPEKVPIKMASPVNGGDLEMEDVDVITHAEASQAPAVKTVDEVFETPPTILQVSFGKIHAEHLLMMQTQTATEPKEDTPAPSTKPTGADTLPSESNPSMTEFSEIIPEQELIVIPTCKDMTESTDQPPPKNESNVAAAKTTSSSSESDTPKETLNTVNPADPEAEEPHRETSTKTDQATTDQVKPLDPESPEPQPQVIQKTLGGLLEGSPSSEHLSSERKFQNLEAHLTEIPASPSLPNLPAIPLGQAVPLPQEATVAILEPQCPVPTPASLETANQTQPKDLTTPVSHTVSAAPVPAVEAGAGAEEEEEISPPQAQAQVETQSEPSLEPLKTSIPQSQEPDLQKEPPSQKKLEQQPPSENSSQLTSSSSEISLSQSTPRTLPPVQINTNSNTDRSITSSSKTPIVATVQEEKAAVGVEIVS
ncbi:hypothetical protein TWF481_012205 [Arthrobotrys musiformis]|uniref:Uncharacterized protein n=1 Tax=Arthrobotrys musiformis TaxID=47236 RepID=A0AAV9VWC1_9PEZI